MGWRMWGEPARLGFLLVITGVTSEAINAVVIRRQLKGADPIQITTVRLVVGAIACVGIVTALGDYSLARVTPTGYMALAVAGLIGALGGQFMAFYVMRTFGATAFSLTSYVTPLIATSLGVVLLGEVVTWGILFGVIFIGVGIWFINRPNPIPQPAT